MAHIKFDWSNAKKFIADEELDYIQPQVSTAHELLREKKGAGSDFTGWVDLPIDYDKEEFARIKEAAEKIKKDSDVLIVIGIGGSYLGARAVIDFLNHTFYNLYREDKEGMPQIFFAGNSISATYLQELIQVIGDKDFSVNVISKSGTTTEPAIAFRVFKEMLEKKYGKEEAGKRIYATTDRARGALKTLADAEGWEEFVVPDAVGGRYSVFTAVGLLPIAAAGIDIDELMKGAADAREAYMEEDVRKNDAYLYAALRNILYRKGKATEILVNYEPNLMYFAEWWKQLFGETEGKNQKGIYPSSANFSTDLHSLGQFIQEGNRNIFETVIHIDKPRGSVKVPAMDNNLDGLGYLEGKDMNYINDKAFEGVVLAHTDGDVPNFIVDLPDMSTYSMGYMMYFFELAAGISGYINAINPFNQPGVEKYKSNMFALLGKPGYEKETEEIMKRLNK